SSIRARRCRFCELAWLDPGRVAWQPLDMTFLPFDPRDPVALTQALIRCPSVTPTEGGALHLLADVLKDAGFETHIVSFSDDDTPDVANLYARIGPMHRPALMFAGHTDVV